MAEFAMVRLRHSRAQIIKQRKGFQGKILFQIHTNLDTYLSACQLGITLASLGLGWIGEPAFARLLESAFYFFNITSQEFSKFISFIIAFSFLSFLHIVVGELMPKSMAIRQSENISLWTSIPLYLFYWVMYPFIWLLNASANILLHLFKLDATHQGEHSYSADEIKFILKSSHSHGELTEEYKNILIHMLEFTHLQAVDVMRPLEEMVSINHDTIMQEKLRIIQQYKYTRYPVYQGDTGNIIGILHTKDVLFSIAENTQLSQLEVDLKPIVKIFHHDKAISILNRFRQGTPHFALIYDHKKLIGFTTLDNVLHTFMGKMSDEFHIAKEDWIKLPNGHFLLKGAAPVYAVEKLMEVDLSQYPVDTIAGLLLHNLGHLPARGEEWQQPTFTLLAKKIRGTRIIEVILIPKSIKE